MFFVYVDWTTEDVPRPFYVGKGNRARAESLVRNDHHENVARKHGIQRTIVESTEDEALAFELEKKLIAEHHTFVGDPAYNGIGTNYTLGGEGSAGLKFSDESLKLLSEARRKSWASSETRANYLESFASETAKTKKREAMLALHSDPEFKKRQLEGIRASNQRSGAREKRSAAASKACARPEVKQKRSEASKRVWRERKARQSVTEDPTMVS